MYFHVSTCNQARPSSGRLSICGQMQSFYPGADGFLYLQFFWALFDYLIDEDRCKQ